MKKGLLKWLPDEPFRFKKIFNYLLQGLLKALLRGRIVLQVVTQNTVGTAMLILLSLRY